MSFIEFRPPSFVPKEGLGHKSLKKGCFNVMKVFLLLMALIIGMIIFANVFYAPQPPVRIPNSVVIKELKLDFNQHDSYKRIVKVMDSIDYDGDLSYAFYCNPSYKHKLKGQYGCLNDTFPWVVPEMSKVYGEVKWPLWIKKVQGVYFQNPLFAPLYIRFNTTLFFIYTRKTDGELQEMYKSFVICDTIGDEDTTSGWLLRLEPNWYLVRYSDSCDKDIY